MFRNINKTVSFFLVSLKYREIIVVKTVTLYNKIKKKKKRSLKSKKKKLQLFYYVSQETWLGNSKKVTCIDQSRFYIFSHPRELKNV